MEKSITKSQNYLLTAPIKGHNDIAVELKVAFHCMIDENYIKEIENEFEKFRVNVSAILERISAKANEQNYQLGEPYPPSAATPLVQT